MKKWTVLAAVLALLLFSRGMTRLDQQRKREDLAILEDALRRTAVACYAAEGFYPPDVAYMQRRYGLQIDSERYTVFYVRPASNLMPDITVVEN